MTVIITAVCYWLGISVSPYKVFLDEVNTSSCMGLFKEIIIDKTFEGEVMYIL